MRALFVASDVHRSFSTMFRIRMDETSLRFRDSLRVSISRLIVGAENNIRIPLARRYMGMSG